MRHGAVFRRADDQDIGRQGRLGAAAVALLDRGWGRPPQAVTCPDGEGSIQV
jgi:hypothetical protein